MKLLRLSRKSSYRLVVTLVLSIILAVLFLPGTAIGVPAAQTLDATNVTATSATLNGQMFHIGSITYRFQYGLTTAYGSNTPSLFDSGPFMFNADISGLSPGTTYHFRVTVSPDDGANWTPYNDKTFTTEAASTSTPTSGEGDYSYIWPEVFTIGSSNISDNSATVTGNLTSLGSAGNYSHHSHQVKVYFKYGKHYYQTIWPLWAGGNVTAYQLFKAPGEFSANITNLNPGTTYYFKAMAYGEGIARGVVKTFTTPLE